MKRNWQKRARRTFMQNLIGGGLLTTLAATVMEAWSEQGVWAAVLVGIAVVGGSAATAVQNAWENRARVNEPMEED